MTVSYTKTLYDFFSYYSNEEDAIRMKKYLRGQFEYFGIRSPERRMLTKEFFKEYGLPERSELQKVIKEIWSQDERELHYVAIDILDKYKKSIIEEDIVLIEYLAVNKSWWDTIDFLSSKLAGNYFKMFPENIKKITGDWINSENFWLNRMALLFQLKYKDQIDETLLFNYIIKVRESKEFFIRKAIGWVLREYSKTNRESVIDFVNENDLSPLSKREALKWLEQH